MAKRTHTRCRKCRGRVALTHHPDWYEKPPECECGGILVPDKWMNERNTKAMRCGCDGMNFGYHRIGSRNPGDGKECKYNPDGSSRYGPEIVLKGIQTEEFPF
ncbi:hypothetical protein SKUL_36 [Pseudomonas phage Skulduggery]|uniref:Uncharacterized protein n=1 Tax=Pseudomonas phage Skulduggery TaxID=2006671 RepID=A0A1Y0SX90_9CAUD|nr:hypothetical protein PP627_gp36 [Pseudomonas phage Skulduggery]ARV77135.1 hypothetical protein SKUL_36 [Pseudomonas phage Skulduggery]